MPGALRLGGADVDGLVDPEGLIGVIEELLRGGARAPGRLSLEHGGSWLASMAAAWSGYYAVKIVGVYPGNPARGLPLVRGVLLLFDASTGEPLLEAPAEEATGWRTAAASALALRILGYRGGGVLGVIGAGVQAEYHLRVLTGTYRFDGVLVYSRTRARAEGLAARFNGQAARGLEELLRASTVVVAATTSREPVVKGALLGGGSYVVSVGAPKPVRELDEHTIRRAGCILVDTREGVLSESGDVPGWVETVELGEALQGRRACRHGDIAVYKSVGTAVFDLAVALHLYRQATRQSRTGTRQPGGGV